MREVEPSDGSISISGDFSLQPPSFEQHIAATWIATNFMQVSSIRNGLHHQTEIPGGIAGNGGSFGHILRDDGARTHGHSLPQVSRDDRASANPAVRSDGDPLERS